MLEMDLLNWEVSHSATARLPIFFQIRFIWCQTDDKISVNQGARLFSHDYTTLLKVKFWALATGI